MNEQSHIKHGICVSQNTLDELDEAAEAIRRARRELNTAMAFIKPLAPNLAVLLDDDILRLAHRHQRVSDIRAGCHT